MAGERGGPWGKAKSPGGLSEHIMVCWPQDESGEPSWSGGTREWCEGRPTHSEAGSEDAKGKSAGEGRRGWVWGGRLVSGLSQQREASWERRWAGGGA